MVHSCTEKHWSDKIKTDNVTSSIETENYTEDLKDKVKVKPESDKDKITTSSKYPDENNNISDDVNDVGQTDQDSNKVKSDIIMNSQKSRKSNWTKTPWAIAVIILICILFVIGSVFGVVKQEGIYTGIIMILISVEKKLLTQKMNLFH